MTYDEIKYYIDNFCKVLNISDYIGIIDLPATKIEKIYTNNEYAQKYISSPIHQLPEQNFIEKYLLCLKLNNKNIMLDNLKDLYFFAFKA